MEKHKKIDTKAIEYHIAGILKALGDNPEREGLKDTPKRVAKMYEEVFDGMNYTNEEIADTAAIIEADATATNFLLCRLRKLFTLLMKKLLSYISSFEIKKTNSLINSNA